MQLPAVTGLTAKYLGSQGLGTTAYSYWVQAIYPDGFAVLSAKITTSALLPAALSSSNRVMLNWAPMPGAIGYIVYSNTTGTTPTSGSIVRFIADAQTGFADVGQSASTGTVRYDGLYVAKAYYDFAVDGGAIAAITPAQSDTIPAGAIMCGGWVNPVVALTSGGSATIAIGGTAGFSATSLLGATAVASYSIDALLALVPTMAAPVKTTAAGKIKITVAVATLLTGVAEIFVLYVLPTNL